MKKTTTSAKTPAPAPKLAAPAPARKSSATPKVKAPAAAAPSAPPVAKAKGSRVTLIAKVDVGFGNSVYIRGDQPYLHWEKGIPLGNIAGDRWEIVLTGVERPFQFKFLRNNEGWSEGENFTASPGDTITLTPVF
ncbi:MAG TPA: CBM20 domain-containing protein [Opitutaceae bacterium]|jgi:hypothetical protein